MALADLCNLNSFMKPNSTTTTAIYEDMVTNQCSNISNNYQLSMPPFENVSLSKKNYKNQKIRDLLIRISI